MEKKKIVRWRAAAAAAVFALGTAGIGGGSLASAAAASQPPGTELWAGRPSTPAGVANEGAAVAVSPGGGTVFVTGTTSASAVEEGAILTIARQAATGKVAWARRYGGTHNSFDHVTAMAVSPAGTRVFVTGLIAASNGGLSSYLTVAYSAATGARLWAVRFGSPAVDGTASSIAVGPGGQTVYVTGTGTGGAGFTTVAYAAATGARRWASSFAIPGSSADMAGNSVTVGPGGGRVYVTGEVVGDYITVAFNSATGARLWDSRYPGLHGRDEGGAASVAAGPGGGRVYVTGTAAGTGGAASDYATVAYSAATGAELWAEHYNADPASGDSGASAIAVTPGGGKVLVAGASGGFGTVAYDSATGAQLWASHLPDSPGGGFATAMTVSRDGGSALVAGPTFPPGETDLTVVAYSPASGARQWDNVPVPHPLGTPAAIAAGVGTVFVVSSDLTTIAYRD